MSLKRYVITNLLNIYKNLIFYNLLLVQGISTVAESGIRDESQRCAVQAPANWKEITRHIVTVHSGCRRLRLEDG